MKTLSLLFLFMFVCTGVGVCQNSPEALVSIFFDFYKVSTTGASDFIAKNSSNIDIADKDAVEDYSEDLQSKLEALDRKVLGKYVGYEVVEKKKEVVDLGIKL